MRVFWRRYYLGRGSFLKQHFSALVEQEDTEGAMQADAVALDSVAVFLAGRSNGLVIRVHQNTILSKKVERQCFVVLFYGVRLMLSETETFLTRLGHQVQNR